MIDPVKFVKRVPENAGVQWDGTLAVADAMGAWLGPAFQVWVARDLSTMMVETVMGGDSIAVSPGQWVIRQNGDPPRVFDDAQVATKFRVYVEGE